MGTRLKTYIAIANASTPDMDARWISRTDAEVIRDGRGTLITFEVNIRPLWARIPAKPGPVPLFDLELEMELYQWLGTIGTEHFRMVRGGGEGFDIAGEWWGAAAFLDNADVRALEREVRTNLGPDRSLLGDLESCLHCGWSPGAGGATCPRCTSKVGRASETPALVAG